MLAITQTAADALDTIADSASAPETGGVRIAHSARADGAVDLSLTLVDSPEPTDQVLESAGHPLFIEAEAASYLDDKVLDAQIQDGQVGFVLGEQEA
ncbi:MAG: HesB/YadR/YfhF-family protein [Actinobacteria bacterium]|nr:MAG: HesB/YadR/YfhF-family protein [Actinomycetota bacterium]